MKAFFVVLNEGQYRNFGNLQDASEFAESLHDKGNPGAVFIGKVEIQVAPGPTYKVLEAI